MDILAYEYMLQGLKDYNATIEQNYGNVVVSIPPNNPSFPLTVFDEIRNVANPNYNGCFERVSSVGYRADIYAKTKGNITKQIIARRIAQQVDKYLTNVGLTRVSFNVSELENDSSIYHIIMTYSGNLQEFRRKFI
jgi:hypothetical protein